MLVIGVTLALSGCSTVDSMTSTVGGWFSSSPSKSPPAELVEFKPAASLTEAWKADTGDIGGYLFSPQADGDDVAAAGGSWVARIVAPTGNLAWRIDTGLRLSAGAGVGQGLVLAGGSEGEFLALDLTNGQLRWKAVLSSEVTGQPLVLADTVIARTGDGSVHGLALADGSRK